MCARSPSPVVDTRSKGRILPERWEYNYDDLLYFFTMTGLLTVVTLYWLLWPTNYIVAYIAMVGALCFPGLSSLSRVDRSLFAPKLGTEDHLLESTGGSKRSSQ